MADKVSTAVISQTALPRISQVSHECKKWSGRVWEVVEEVVKSEIVKLLVEHGADFNCVWDKNNALGLAVLHQRRDIEEYLRSIGAKA